MTKDRLMLLVIALASSLAFLGLAALGAGGIGAFLAHPPLAAAAAITLALTIVSCFSEGHLGAGEREDRGNRWVIPVFGAIAVLDAFLPAYMDRLDLLTLDGEAIRWVGVLLFATGGALRLWPVFVLGRRFSGLVAIQPGHELETAGPYAVIRHPSYLGLLVTLIGWALVFRSGAGLALAALTIPPLVARMNAEETLLRGHFGARYDAYRARTARLVPGIY
jgi:protein-S-isoprenylcysteine O-methyltransferase Ste14